MRILWIGNSYTQRNDLPAIVAAMASSGQPPVLMQHKRVIANGASLRRHWNAGEAVAAILCGSWDYVVLQEQSTLPIKNAARYHENVRLFDEVIRQCGAKTVLYATWARQNAPETQTVLNSATMAIAEEIGAVVAPVGLAWQQAMATEPELLLYDNDGSHPSPIGSYLAASVFYTKLFEQAPVGSRIPEGIDVPESLGHLLQEIAWKVVSEQNPIITR